MKKLLFIATVLFTVLTLPSCESIDSPDTSPVFTDITVNLEYIGPDDFKGELSKIAVFVTDENGNFIVRQADKIDKDTFITDCRPGKYVISAEYVNSDTEDDNIILESVNVELKAYQPLEVVLKIDLTKIEKQN
ncbi:MAG: hypothetical protein K2G21_02230 [Muribaculaceae bacterium]|nr:hypothetical protein [Muribaculaceae bacterium]